MQVADLHAAATRTTKHRYSHDEQSFLSLEVTQHRAQVFIQT